MGNGNYSYLQLFKKPHPQKRLALRLNEALPMGVVPSQDKLFFHNVDNLRPAKQAIKGLFYVTLYYFVMFDVRVHWPPLISEITLTGRLITMIDNVSKFVSCKVCWNYLYFLYCKPTFIQVKKNVTWFPIMGFEQIFLSADQAFIICKER